MLLDFGPDVDDKIDLFTLRGTGTHVQGPLANAC